MIDSITLLGSSSGRNAGDAALMAGIMDSVDEACGSKLLYEIPTIKPSFIRGAYSNRTQPVSILPWNGAVKIFGIPTYQSVMRTDMSLVFDAVLFDRSLYNPLFNFLSTFWLLLPRAKRRGKKLGFFNVTAGPVRTKQGQKMLRELAEEMDFITVRDQDSYDILREIGVKNPNMLTTADAALIVKPSSEARVNAILQELGLGEREILAININQYLDSWAGITTRKPLTKEAFLESYSGALNAVLKDIDADLLFVATQHHDVDITRELMQRVRAPHKKAFLSNVKFNHAEVKGVLGRVSLLFAMRLHAMILASGALAPVAGLAYLPKNHHYFKSLSLPEFSFDFEGYSEDYLKSALRKSWESRGRIRAQLNSRIPELQAEARKAAYLVAQLRAGRSAEEAIAQLASTSRANTAVG